MILGFGGIFPFLGIIPAMIAERKGRRGFVWWVYGTTLFIIERITGSTKQPG